MNASLVRCLGLALLLPLALHAQTVPAPKEFYFDEDTTNARPIVAIAGDDEATLERLMQLMQRGRRDADRAAAQLAHVAMRTGRTEVGHALYRRAFDDIPPRNALRHALHWNYGWDLVRTGDIESALQHWLTAGLDRLIDPEWLPPTLALALWRLDRHDEALAWYAAAVRTWPNRWRSPGDFGTLLPDWRDDERQTLGEVHAAWLENPPAWP